MPLRVVPSFTALPSKRCPGIGVLSRAYRKNGVLHHVATPTRLRLEYLVRPASSCIAPGRSRTHCRQSRGIDPLVAIGRGYGAQMKWSREPQCSSRMIPVCRRTFGVALGCQVPFPTSRRNVGLLLRRCSGQGPHLAMTREPRGFSRVAAGFSSYDGDFRLPLVLAQEVQSSIRLARESWGLHSSHCRAKRPHLGLCPGRNVPLQGRQGSRGCIPGSPGESGLVSRGSQGLRSPLESRCGSLVAP